MKNKRESLRNKSRRLKFWRQLKGKKKWEINCYLQAGASSNSAPKMATVNGTKIVILKL